MHTHTHTHSHTHTHTQFMSNACGYAESHINTADLQGAFYISGIAVELGDSCLPRLIKSKEHIQSLVIAAMESEVTMDTLYLTTTVNTVFALEGWALFSLTQHTNVPFIKLGGRKCVYVYNFANISSIVNSESVLASILTVLDSDESIHKLACPITHTLPTFISTNTLHTHTLHTHTHTHTHSTALAFLTASQLSGVNLDAIFDLVEVSSAHPKVTMATDKHSWLQDVVAQADETTTSLYVSVLTCLHVGNLVYIVRNIIPQ